MLVRLIVAALATWRLSSLLLYEEGPFEVFMRLRSAVDAPGLGHAQLRVLFGCIYCMSVWTGLLCAMLMMSDLWVAMLPFALSAVAVMVDKCSAQLSK